MSDRQQRVLELLEVWAERAERGQEVRTTELCAECPELLEEVEGQVRFLGRLARLVLPAVDPYATTAPKANSTPPPGHEFAAVSGAAARGPAPVIPNHDILGLLGQGGMGAVYRACNRRLGRIVALKVIKDRLAGPTHLARFQVEAEAVAQLNHPHIVQIYEAGGWRPAEGGGELPYLALEYVEGTTLEQRVGGQPVEPADAARLVWLLARAVRLAHAKGIIHRDLKPGNVLLAPPADEPALNCAWGCPKLTDFGLARRLGSGEGLTQSGVALGTPNYMAPEQAEGDREIGPAADVYGLGGILYKLLTGQAPLGRRQTADRLFRLVAGGPIPPHQVRAEVPEGLSTLCQRCLEKDPVRRATLADLLAGLERFLAGDPPPVATKPAPPPARPRWARWGLVAACLLGALLLVSGLVWRAWPSGGSSADGGPAGAPLNGGGGDAEGKNPLKGELLRVRHYQRLSRTKSANRGVIGEESHAAHYDDAVTVRVKLSAPGYFYLLAFNADGKEQLLWPADEENRPLPAAAPPKLRELLFPQGGERITLNDEPRGGLQVFVVLASRRPLPSYAEWVRQRGRVGWARRKPGEGVWQADDRGVYEVTPGEGADRSGIKPPAGAPPLKGLCKRLRVGGVEVVEAIAFSVLREAVD
jgi:serine/threonine protein kinase